MRHIIHIAQLILSLIGCIGYPIWIKEGYIDNLYLYVAVFIASYGSFIGGLIWYIQFLKILKKSRQQAQSTAVKQKPKLPTL